MELALAKAESASVLPGPPTCPSGLRGPLLCGTLGAERWPAAWQLREEPTAELWQAPAVEDAGTGGQEDPPPSFGGLAYGSGCALGEPRACSSDAVPGLGLAALDFREDLRRMRPHRLSSGYATHPKAASAAGQLGSPGLWAGCPSALAPRPAEHFKAYGEEAEEETAAEETVEVDQLEEDSEGGDVEPATGAAWGGAGGWAGQGWGQIADTGRLASMAPSRAPPWAAWGPPQEPLALAARAARSLRQ